MDETARLWVDLPVTKIIEFFTTQTSAWLNIALQLGQIIALLGIIYSCIQICFGTMEVRKFGVGFVTKYFLFLLVMSLYPIFCTGLKSFSFQLANYVSGSPISEIQNSLGTYYEKLSAIVESSSDTYVDEISSLDNKIRKLEEVALELEEKKNQRGYREALREAQNEIDSLERQKKEYEEKLMEVNDDSSGAAKTLNALKSILIINENNVTNKYHLNLWMNNSVGGNSNYLSPNAILRLNLLTAQIMWQTEWEDDVLKTWEENGQKHKFAKNIKRLSDFPLSKIFDIILCFITMIMMIISSCVNLIQYVMCIIEFAICSTVSIILVPCILFDGLKDMANKILPFLLSQAIKLTMITLCMYFCIYTYLDLSINTITEMSGFSLVTFAGIAFTILLTFTLTSNAPKLAAALLTGQPQMSMGEFVQAAGAVAGGAVAAKRAVAASSEATKQGIAHASQATANRLGDAAAMVGGAQVGMANAKANGKNTVGGAISGALGVAANRTGNRIKGKMQDMATYSGKNSGGAGSGSVPGSNRFKSNDPMLNSSVHSEEKGKTSLNYKNHSNENGTKSTLGEYLKQQKESGTQVRKDQIGKSKDRAAVRSENFNKARNDAAKGMPGASSVMAAYENQKNLMNGTAHYTGDVTGPSPIQKEADSHVNGTKAMSSFSKQHPDGSEMGNWEA